MVAVLELHKRCGTFAGHFAGIGRRLEAATTAYNHAVGSFEGRVLPQLRRIEQIHAMSAGTVAAPAAVDTVVRRMDAAELPTGLEGAACG